MQSRSAEHLEVEDKSFSGNFFKKNKALLNIPSASLANAPPMLSESPRSRGLERRNVLFRFLIIYNVPRWDMSEWSKIKRKIEMLHAVTNRLQIWLKSLWRPLDGRFPVSDATLFVRAKYPSIDSVHDQLSPKGTRNCLHL